MKCEICGKKITKNLLNKINGTYVKDENGKLHVVCSDCQRKYKTKEELIKAIMKK